ncbi:hypothetical protein UlMin_010262 [Ulmus minor]
MDDLDMDMDVPLPEELELLEANYRSHEEHPDFEEPHQPFPDEDEEPPINPPSSSETLINGQKRLRSSSNGPDASALAPESAGPSDEKRSRIDETGLFDRDEDWLRHSPPKENDPVAEEVAPASEERIVFRYASEIDGDCIPVTAPGGGDRVYAKISREERDERPKKLDAKTRSGGLTWEPIGVLLQKLEQEAFEKVLQVSSEGQSDMILPESPVVHERLWVDKYAPNSFTELLSDEQTNREVLLWLKQWDSKVFGSELRSTSNEVLSALKRHTSFTQHQKLSDSNFLRKNRGTRWNKENFRNSNDLDQINSNSKGDQDLWSKKSNNTGPLEHKILLLCGPPGLGKTTLAHVAARHCGYRVVEINASDDRSSSTIETKILDVVQMNSVTADSRPKCLVIDEIDGALGDGKGAVEVILKMVLADRKSDLGKENVAKEENPQRISGKKGRKTSSLTRPVICICNDLYAPVLRPLRQVAKVHVFVQPTVSRVVSRLKYICNKEGMKTSSIALTALAEHTECDIRSCLNTLQFLHKKKEALNVLEISSQVVGQKDMTKSVFDVWKEIFQKRKVKRERSICSSQTVSNKYDFLHSLVKCLNSLCVSDRMHQYIFRTQQMPLLVYQPAIAVTVHHLVAQVQKPNIEWPKSYQRYRTMRMEKIDTLRSWYHTIPPYISRHLSINSFVEESVSPLLHILSPPTLRPVALKLLSDKEKNDLDQLISTMVSLSITYRNVKSNPLSRNPTHDASSDSTGLAFDPQITEFVNFKDYRSAHSMLSLAIKQVLVHEVEKQRILQASTGRFVHATDGFDKENQVLLGKETSRVQPDQDDHSGTCAKNVENPANMSNLRHSTSSTPAVSSNLGSGNNAITANSKLNSSRDKNRSSRGSSSFFDRFRKHSKGSQNTDTSLQNEETLERDLRPLLFKFNEGFTNAVKRPVRVREFLL